MNRTFFNFAAGAKKSAVAIVLGLIMMSFTGCYSVYNGGTGGLVVDSESTSNPKDGIANVDVYAYLDCNERDSDFNNWQEATKFSPQAEYYGHTTTGSDGNFTISKLVWKETKPDFGKDADYTNVYLLFYHENYGLTKSETVIISDSVSDNVYVELTAVRKTTVLNMNFVDAASGNNTGNSVYVKISVPQSTAVTTAEPKVYEANITGTGSVSISYPRWISAADKTAKKENTPEVSITYEQSGDEITWKGCYNKDNEDKNYAFRADAETGIKKIIKNSNYSLTFYGKSTRLSVPSVDGQYVSAGDSTDDGVLISLKKKDSDGNYTIDLGETTTSSQTLGTSSSEKHGVFSGLGSGYYWEDTEYTEKYSTAEVQIAGGTLTKELTIRSDAQNYNIQLQ